MHAPRPSVRTEDAEDSNLFRLLVAQVVDYAIFMLTPEGYVASWNAGAERLKGYSAAEAIGQHLSLFYTPRDRADGRPARLLAAARRDGRVEDEGWRVRRDGSRFWADVIITALRDEAGDLIGYAKVTRDLTALRAAEEELRQNELRFRTLVDSVKDYAIFLLSPEGIVLTWNQGAQALKGYAPDEIIGHSFERFYPDAERAAGRPRSLLLAARTDGRVEDEGWRVRNDGSLFWADVVITALRDGDGALIGYAKVTRDLTDRRQAEHDRAARLAAERATRRVETLQSATAALAAATHVHEAAAVLVRVAVQLVGASSGFVAVPGATDATLDVLEVGGGPDYVVLPSSRLALDTPSPLTHAYHSRRALFLESRPQLEAECPELAAGLEPSHTQAWASVPLSIGRDTPGVLGLRFGESRSLDLDERGFLLALGEVGAQAFERARLYEAERVAREEAEAALRTQDEFLSVAAHELRTPVAAVKVSAQLGERALARGKFDTERQTQHLRTISRAADRLAALIDDLLDVSRLRTGRLELRRVALDPGPIVYEIVSRYQSTSEQHQFPLTVPRTPTQVFADPLRLEQVLDNLLSNAVKYTPGGGAIAIAYRRDSDGVLFTVKDEGIGLPAGQEQRIFEAFGRGSNAANRQIQGLGLGLAICRELVEAHGGRIWADSPGEGRGTEFSLWLPDQDHDPDGVSQA